MTPDEFRQTQQGGRWYQLWLRERNPLRKAEYQRLFNEDLKKINGEAINNEKMQTSTLDILGK